MASPPSWQLLEASNGKLAAITLGSFEGRPNETTQTPVRIHYRFYENRNEKRGAVIISSGRTEGLALYQEVIHDLLANGYSAYILDHRGQGFSSRLLPPSEDQTKGYVDVFSNYIEDFSAFVTLVSQRRAGSPAPMFILAHSMGGAIASLYLAQTPARSIRAAALVTPMHEPATGDGTSFKARLAQRYCERVATSMEPISRLSTRYATGGPFAELYDQYLASSDKQDNDLTHSLQRLDANWQARQARCEGTSCGHPDAEVGGATLRWANEACAATREARGPAAARIGVPVLLLQGGQDMVVDPAAQVEFCQNVNRGTGGGYCQGYRLGQARHALLIERDDLRNAGLARALSFFACTAAGSERCK